MNKKEINQESSTMHLERAIFFDRDQKLKAAQ